MDEALYERAQRRRQPRYQTGRPPRERGALRGRVVCCRCGRPLHSESNRAGHALYRERHSFACDTNGRAVAASRVDAQLGRLVAALPLDRAWRKRIVAEALRPEQRESAEELQARRRRLARAYADGAFPEAEYEALLAEVDAALARVEPVRRADVETVVALAADAGRLWQHATHDERQRLVEPLVDRVVVDLETKAVVAVAPVPAFAALLAAVRADGVAIWTGGEPPALAS